MKARSQSPQRSNLLGVTGSYGGSAGDPSAGRPGYRHLGTRGGNADGSREQSELKASNVFGGNLAGLPGHVREQGGRLFKNVPGIYSGPIVVPRLDFQENQLMIQEPEPERSDKNLGNRKVVGLGH